MIKRSLKAKLIISYLSVALLTILVISVYIRSTSGKQLFNLVVEQQVATLKEIAVKYYSVTGSWDGFFSYYLRSNLQDGMDKPKHDPGFKQSLQSPRGLHGLVDSEYRAIIPTYGYEIGAIVASDQIRDPIPITLDGKTIAWILPDTGFQFKLSTEEQFFLERTNEAILLAALAGMLGAVLMGILLASVFLKPIRNLMIASRALAKGELEQQVPVTSQDELGQLSSTFNQMSNDLAHADQQRRQMTADITHDLSTPLQVIAGYLEMFEDDEVALTADRIQIMMTEIEHLHRLVDDLGMISQADANEIRMELQPNSPSELLGRIFSAYYQLAQNQGVELLVDVKPDVPDILVDENRMARVLSNLVDNALRYTPDGGRITLSTHHTDETVEIHVQDTGSGISPEDLPYVFDRFYRADKSREGNSGKLGLGLTICKALVNDQGGTIMVKSAGKGQGTDMIIHFKTGLLKDT